MPLPLRDGMMRPSDLEIPEVPLIHREAGKVGAPVAERCSECGAELEGDVVDHRCWRPEAGDP